MTGPLAIAVEVGNKRVFASVLDWPGWCRSGKTEDDALAALADYAPRYAPVAKLAGLPFATAAKAGFQVVEHLPGSGGTDYGVPMEVAQADHRPVTAKDGARLAALVKASWATLVEVAAHSPESLRKGPRGGGRDRDAIVQHVVSAEAVYARKLGIKMKEPAAADATAVASLRDAILEVIGQRSDGQPLVERGWPIRYAARRVAWHVLDHAWEIEDRRH